MTIALFAALAIGEFFTALVITAFVLAAEVLEGLTAGADVPFETYLTFFPEQSAFGTMANWLTFLPNRSGSATLLS